MIANWIKLYLKTFAKNKVFSTLNIVGLSVGIASVILVLLYLKNEQSYDQWNPYKDRIYEVYSGKDYFKQRDGVSPWMSAPFADKLDKLSDVVEAYNFSYDFLEETSIRIGDKKEFLFDVAEKQANIFEFFPFETVYGSAEDYKNNREDALALEAEQASRLFGKGVNPVGEQITEDGGKLLTVRYVYRIPDNSSVDAKAMTAYWAEARIKENRESNNWTDANFNLLIKLKEGIALTDVKKYISNVMYEDHYEDSAKQEEMTVQEYKEKYKKDNIFQFHVLDKAHLNPDSLILGAGHNIQKTLNIMLGVSVLILLLAVLNAVNLSLVNSFQRAKEIGVKKVLGATRGSIVRQFMFETGITVFFSLTISFVIVELLLPYFNLFINRNLVFSALDFLPVLLFISALLIVFSGVLPALFLSGFKVLNVLKGNYMRRQSGAALRNTLLVFQFVIAFFFLTVAFLVNKQVNFMLNQDLGFNGDQVVNIRYKIKAGINRYKHYQKFEADLKKIKGVKAVAVHGVKFGGEGFRSSSTNIIGEESLQSNNVPVSYDFLEVFDIKVKEGRFFDRKLASDSIDKVLVNETFERIFDLKDGVMGKKIVWNSKEFEVIGVLKDFNSSGFAEEIEASTFFMPNSVSWFSNALESVSVKIDSKNVQQTLKDIETFWNTRVDDEYGIRYGFANQDFARSYQNTMNQRVVFNALMVISVFIALFGLMALVSFSMESRLKEVSIRKVLGASTEGLLINLCKKFVFYCVLGFLISIYPVVYLMNIWLEDYAYRIDVQWTVFGWSFVVLTLFSVALVLWKAWRATQVNVLKYVNYE